MMPLDNFGVFRIIVTMNNGMTPDGTTPAADASDAPPIRIWSSKAIPGSSDKPSESDTFVPFRDRPI